MSFELPRYYPIDEFEYPSVTTIIDNAVPKPWLAPWGRKVMAIYMRDMLLEDIEKLWFCQ